MQGPVLTALLDDWPKAKLKEALANGSLMQPEEVAQAVLFMLMRSKGVTVRDLVILPSSVDLQGGAIGGGMGVLSSWQIRLLAFRFQRPAPFTDGPMS